MTLATVKPGDLVRVASAHAEVRDKQRGKLLIRWLGNGTSERWVKAREVEAAWRRVGRVTA